jgi:hypothetical protein
MALTPQQRVELGLDDPATLPAEFAQPLPSGGAPARVNNLRLTLKSNEKATGPMLRRLTNELLASNMQEADYALKQLFAMNPKAGLEAYIQLCKFGLPQLSAMAVQLDDTTSSPRAASFADLQRIISEQ